MTKVFYKVNSEIDSCVSDNPLVNGKSMTTNPDKLYRLDRHISTIAKWQRTAKTRELINYCKWKIGELDICSKPSATVAQILSKYKQGRLDDIPENFKVLIQCHKDLVDKAVSIDLRKRKMKGDISMAKTMTTRKKHVRQSFDKEAYRRLRVWAGSNIDGTALPTLLECSAVKYFQLHGKKGYSNTYSQPLLRTMLKYPELVEKLYVDTKAQTITLKTDEQKTLSYEELYKTASYKKAIAQQKKNNKYVEQVRKDVEDFKEYCEYRLGKCSEYTKPIKKYWMSIFTMTKQNKVHLISNTYRAFVSQNKDFVLQAAAVNTKKLNAGLLYENKVEQNIDTVINKLKMIKSETGRVSHTESHQTTESPSSSSTVPDTLSMLIQLAKKSGATELVIKL